MNRNKKIAVTFIAGFIFIFSLLLMTNRWASMEMKKAEKTFLIEQKTVKPSEKKIISHPEVSLIDPLNDPLAPIKKRMKDKKATVDDGNRHVPSVKYEMSMDSPILVQ